MRLRIPINDGVANNAPTGGPPMGVQVHVPAALNRPTHTLYSICMSVQPTLQEWTVNRRYSQFLALRDDVLAALLGSRRGGCPACASFALAVRKFPFPRKTLLRTSRSVRKRVKSLEAFLQLLVERLFNDLPKCHVCGEQVKKMVRPFLVRGAQPIGDSTPAKIQHSLSLQSYAVIKHRPRRVDVDLTCDDDDDERALHKPIKKAPASNSSDESYATTMRTGSDPAMDDDTSLRHSPSRQQQQQQQQQHNQDAVDFAATTRSEDLYGQQFDAEPRCTDTPVALEEALKQVVIVDKRKNTLEEIAFRLTTMWDAYDLDETLAAAPQLGLRLSQSLLEEGSEDGMGVTGTEDYAGAAAGTAAVLGGGDRDDVFDEDDDVIHMLEPEDENNVSLALLQDEFVFEDDAADDARETLPVDTVSYAF